MTFGDTHTTRELPASRVQDRAHCRDAWRPAVATVDHELARWDTPVMPDEAAAAGRFTATAPLVSIKSIPAWAFGTVAAFCALPFAVHAAAPELTQPALVFCMLAIAIAFAGFGLLMSRKGKQLSICVTGNGVMKRTASLRPRRRLSSRRDANTARCAARTHRRRADVSRRLQ
jgi:hypothetical protein